MNLMNFFFVHYFTSGPDPLKSKFKFESGPSNQYPKQSSDDMGSNSSFESLEPRIQCICHCQEKESEFMTVVKE